MRPWIKRTIFGALILLTMAPQFAHAFVLTVVGAGNQTNPKPTAPAGSLDQLLGWKGDALGGGGLLRLNVLHRLAFETGGLYLQHKFSISDVTANTKNSSSAYFVEIPAALRFQFLKYFSAIGGVYYQIGIGDVNVVTGPAYGPGGYTSTNLSYANSGWTKDNYGLVGGLAIDIPLGVMTGFVIDGRYKKGLKNISTQSTAVRLDETTLLAGFRLGFSE